MVDMLTLEYRANIAKIEARSARRIANSWRSLSLDNVATVRDAMTDVVLANGIAYGETTSLLAAQYYDDLRVSERVPSKYVADIATDFDTAATAGSIRWAVDPLNGGSSTDALARVQVVGSGIVNAIASQTVMRNVGADPRAQGWNRVARAGSCDFCVMLSQRGAVYKSATADFAAHNNDKCSARPSWDASAPEVDVKAYEASQKTTRLRELDKADGGNRLAHHQANIAGWIEGNTKTLDAFRSELL
jgi:hypothetical protein